MRGAAKKGTAFAGLPFDQLFSQISKAALIDVLYCACQLGTDETPEQIASQAARNALIALEGRCDRVPHDLRRAAEVPIDSD